MPTGLFSHNREEPAMEQEERAKAQEAPHRLGQGPAACGGLKPVSVMCSAWERRKHTIHMGEGR